MLIGLPAETVECRPMPMLIVETLDVVEDVRSGIIASAIVAMMEPLALQSDEESLHRRIVIPVAGAVHMDLDTAVLQ
jgi:hypothetical protein